MAIVAPATESTLKLKPMLIRWLVKARPLLSFCIAASDPVAAHCFAWLGVEVRRDSRGNGGLGSGDLSDGWPDHPVVHWAGPYFNPHEGDSAPVQAAQIAQSAANAAVVAAHLVAAIASSKRSEAHDRGNVVFGGFLQPPSNGFSSDRWALITALTP